YPVDEQYTTHSIPMILINVSEEIYMAARELNDYRQQELKRDMGHFLDEILDLTTDKRIMEMQHIDPSVHNLLTDHLNPGHTLESIWFMIHSMKRMEHPDYQMIVEKLETIAIYAIEK